MKNETPDTVSHNYWDHNYQLKLMRMGEEGKVPSGSGLWHCDIRHDQWCDFLRGAGLCNCDPDIRFIPAAEWTNAMSAPRQKP